MRALIITVAGTSSRFSESVGKPTLKCIYHEGDASGTLLGRLLQQAAASFDIVVIVGGFKFDELEEQTLKTMPPSILEKIRLVYNDHYADRGSGWSLYLGLQNLMNDSLDSILFVEGDLYVADESMAALCRKAGDAITYTDAPVEAHTSVALYEDANGHPKYVYDTAHGLLSVPEPFKWIRSSGQIWRFGAPKRLFAVMEELPESVHAGTNLELVNAYFARMKVDEVDLISLREWVNCNTIQDYRRAFVGEE